MNLNLHALTLFNWTATEFGTWMKITPAVSHEFDYLSMPQPWCWFCLSLLLEGVPGGWNLPNGNDKTLSFSVCWTPTHTPNWLCPTEEGRDISSIQFTQLPLALRISPNGDKAVCFGVKPFFYSVKTSCLLKQNTTSNFFSPVQISSEGHHQISKKNVN